MIDDLMYHEMPCIAKEIRCFYDFFDYFLLSHRESTYYERINILTHSDSIVKLNSIE